MERRPRAVAELGPVRLRPVGPERLAVLGGGGEDLLADQVGRDVGHDLELGAVFQHLGQPAVHERRLAPAAEQLVDLLLDLPAGHPHALAEDQQQALGRLEPLRALAIEIERDHPLLGDPDPDQSPVSMKLPIPARDSIVPVTSRQSTASPADRSPRLFACPSIINPRTPAHQPASRRVSPEDVGLRFPPVHAGVFARHTSGHPRLPALRTPTIRDDRPVHFHPCNRCDLWSNRFFSPHGSLAGPPPELGSFSLPYPAWLRSAQPWP